MEKDVVITVEVTKYKLQRRNAYLNKGKYFAFSVLRLTLNSYLYVTFCKIAPKLPNKLPNEL